MSDFLIFGIVMAVLVLFFWWMTRKVNDTPPALLPWEETPCEGKYGNRCVAEGCFGQACRRVQT